MWAHNLRLSFRQPIVFSALASHIHTHAYLPTYLRGPDFFDFPARVLNSPAFCSSFCCALLLALAAHPGCYVFLLAGLDSWVFRARVLNSLAFCSIFAGSQARNLRLPFGQAVVFWLWFLRLLCCYPKLRPDFSDFSARVLNSPAFCSTFCCALLLALAAHPGC